MHKNFSVIFLVLICFHMIFLHAGHHLIEFRNSRYVCVVRENNLGALSEPVGVGSAIMHVVDQGEGALIDVAVRLPVVVAVH